MGTRSRIGIQLSDNSILSAYHHWDGYPSWLGKILRTHYTTTEKVSELIDGGDMSSCWTDERWDSETKVQEYGPQYYSQRGEDCPPRLDENLKQFIENGEEYGYIFRNGEWICYNTRSWDDNYGKEETIPTGALAE
jgi:hypothetical protein